ncbi:hypothetical protein FALBO_13083 [Fusarium albosuccineum]|uniref:Uncharacterized protein n=1 Tax=Fusarium albosuccineum TaxID=1237068 RepID=A0A8H4L268_9HYPO|nr:hypothetical protein FALBO_13083 [Fusarium albosuccineum]
MASPPTTLTTLPFEMRRQIFIYAFKVDGGYVFNGDSEKLTMADGKPINLALMYTCRSIANDTKGMPLSVNTINFSTVYRRAWNGVAGCFNYVRIFYRLLQEDLVLRLAPFMTPDMYSELGQRHPAFVSPLRNESARYETHVRRFVPERNIRVGKGRGYSSGWHQSHLGTVVSNDYYNGFGHLHCLGHLWGRWYGPMWETEQATSYCLRLLAEKEPAEFSRLVYEALPQWVDTHPAHEFLDLMFPPWAIPSQAEMANVASRLEANNACEAVESWYYRPSSSYSPTRSLETSWTATGTRCREKIRFSATAVAIRFLDRLPTGQRLKIRRVTLHENLPAVCSPSVHAEGLAPFFRENQRLQVERRVSVMRCIAEEDRLVNREIEKKFGRPQDVAWFLQQPNEPEFENRNLMTTDSFSKVLVEWLLDALAVPGANIPAESFTFVLEGEPWVDFCSDLFQQVVHRDVAWQKAFDATIDRGYLRRGKGQIWDLTHNRLEEAMKHLSKQASPLSSDFNTGHPWDFELIVEQNQLLNKRLSWISAYQNLPRFMEFPPELDYATVLADHYEIQTEDEYR